MEYEKVPEILTGKDMDYLKDAFNWNYGAYKDALDGSLYVTDEKLSNHLSKCSNVFYDHMDLILQIMEADNNENTK